MDSENQLVDRIGRSVPSRSAGGRSLGLRLGIGDDAAIFAPTGRTDWVLSCDAFLQGVHFLPRLHPPDSVGYKALVRAASDLAAMGATPRLFLLTLALPTRLTGAWLDSFLRGMGRATRKLDMLLIGGDTTRSRSVYISVTVLGEVPRGRALKRGGARAGDIIYVSGKLGRAQLGLKLILNRPDGQPRPRRGELRLKPQFEPCLRRYLWPHLYPEIRVKLGEWLTRHRVASAMMDISDGLSTDLTRLCLASRAGAVVWSARIPRVSVPASIVRKFKELNLDPQKMSLHGGDDYELLFTVSPRNVTRLHQAPRFRELTPIGEITSDRRIIVVGEDGKSERFQPGGWDPFR